MDEKPKVSPLWIRDFATLLAGGGIALVWFIFFVVAFSPSRADAALQTKCPEDFAKLQYDAQFKLQGKPMRIQIGSLKKAEVDPSLKSKKRKFIAVKSQPTQWVAKIMNEGQNSSCHAVCEVEELENEDHFDPLFLGMMCRSAAFGPAKVPAVIVWKPQIDAKNTTLIRFGSWLNGYVDATLKVKFDGYAALDPAALDPVRSPRPALAKAD